MRTAWVCTTCFAPEIARRNEDRELWVQPLIAMSEDCMARARGSLLVGELQWSRQRNAADRSVVSSASSFYSTRTYRVTCQRRRQKQQTTNNTHTTHTTHTTQAFDSNTRFLVCVTVMFQNPAVGVSMDAERATGAAFRRRQRRLRSWLRHERQSVAMELAAALHHSRDARSEVAHEAPRGQKTASSGSRPAALKEPELLVGGARGAAMPGLRCAVARPRCSGRRRRRWCGRLLPRLPCPSRQE